MRAALSTMARGVCFVTCRAAATCSTARLAPLAPRPPPSHLNFLRIGRRSPCCRFGRSANVHRPTWRRAWWKRYRSRFQGFAGCSCSPTHLPSPSRRSARARIRWTVRRPHAISASGIWSMVRSTRPTAALSSGVVWSRLRREGRSGRNALPAKPVASCTCTK